MRLERGDYDASSRARRDPVGARRALVEAGARLIHLVDLDGARSGRLRPDRRGAARRRRRRRRPSRRRAAFGRSRTRRACWRPAPRASSSAPRRLPSRTRSSCPIALGDGSSSRSTSATVSRDVRLDRGTDALRPTRRSERCAAAGVSRLLCTAVDRDGTLDGPDLDLLDAFALVRAPRARRRGDPLARTTSRAIEAAGCEGAIVGRALLDGRLPLSILQRP